MKRVFIAIAAMLTVALVASTIFWYFVLSQNPASQTAPGTTAKPTPAVGFGSLRPYAGLCAQFQKVKYEISCEKAVVLALGKTQGDIQKVSIGSVQAVIPGSNPPKRGNVEVWLIDIRIQKPYFDKNFKKEVKVLRVGIGLHQHWGFYKKVLE